jgi:adenylate cyclase
VERKLTTIMCADVSGYSRLMEADEAGTLATLKLYRDAMVGLIERHRGRLVSTSGDSLLADFRSVVEAVQCAAEIQRELANRNRSAPDARRMEFRIGINLGDVMVEGGDLYGEGVNVAARLEALADPGGICISRTVYDQVRNRLTLGYDFIGEQAVKNISEPVPVYRVQLDGTARRDRRRPERSPPLPVGDQAEQTRRGASVRFGSGRFAPGSCSRFCS